MTIKKITHRFVEAIPENLEDGVLYLAMDYATAIHKCACGCGREVVTPLSPTDWKMSYDGVSISLAPSIGNWSFPCRSHYWIKHNDIRWAGDMSNEAISAGRDSDRRAKGRYFNPPEAAAPEAEVAPASGLWHTVRSWFSGK
ncbi:DUF6527 family protein [Sedimentitalea sp. JM2-8]|uniref:DUF6527 family protein n=1 Tax=Sedimentitalea xiamensis TaxID=3050037 RepID=A0ABT7FK14_9RHOB|nr:DUF6527 family protein [Sedimentitalea xiamensis]MDK3075491.1 DUF6527 family protein [Sedimentitalea xiamensis]